MDFRRKVPSLCKKKGLKIAQAAERHKMARKISPQKTRHKLEVGRRAHLPRGVLVIIPTLIGVSLLAVLGLVLKGRIRPSAIKKPRACHSMAHGKPGKAQRL